ncbi:MAG: hypothetical protein ACRDRD_21835, partial [Pseudonocardiaceae bacterium]
MIDGRLGDRGRAVARSVPPLAAIAAVVVLLFALTTERYFQSRWPLSVTAAIIGLGLVAGRLAQVAGRHTLHRS